MSGLPQTLVFGQHVIPFSQVFFQSPLSFGIVNLMPVVKGHVLVIPKRKVHRFCELSNHEVADLWMSAKDIGRVIEREFFAQSLTFAIQDGKFAGQTVEHVHVHIIPRKPNDFNQNDDVYVEIEKRDREKRSEEEMATEAKWLSTFFNLAENQFPEVL